ncbi:MAG: hypothetical protein ACPGJS_05135 [Flammeovirgaceae bacterium]
MTEIKSEGKCHFCDKILSQRGINRHLHTHLSKLEERKGTSFLVYVKADLMFLSLWVDGAIQFGDLDDFLRAIWLECCGHLSAFRDQKGYYSHPDTSENEFWMEPDPHEVPFTLPVKRVFTKGKKLEYEYDFGSSTYLAIEIKNEYSIQNAEGITLLSRNEPLELRCNTCGKQAATEICTVHLWDGMGLFCEKCGEKHAEKCEDFAEYAGLPVVNSPRMGVCAYEGGRIDTARDGIFK